MVIISQKIDPGQYSNGPQIKRGEAKAVPVPSHEQQTTVRRKTDKDEFPVGVFTVDTACHAATHTIHTTPGTQQSEEDSRQFIV